MRNSNRSILGNWIQYTREMFSPLWKLEARIKGVQMEKDVFLIGRPLISVASGSTMRMGAATRIVSAVRSTPLACFQPSVLRTLHPKAELILGEKVAMSGTVICAGLSIKVGCNTIFGSGALVFDNDFHKLDENFIWQNEYQKGARPICIGDHVFVGARAIILKGVSIGDHSIVGAGSVVVKDVPAHHIAVGNPARNLPRS